MSDRPERLERPRSSRQRYRGFVQDYKQRLLDDPADAGTDAKQLDDAAKADEDASALGPQRQRRGKRREYLRWLRPPGKSASSTSPVLQPLGRGVGRRRTVERMLLATKPRTGSGVSDYSDRSFPWRIICLSLDRTPSGRNQP